VDPITALTIIRKGAKMWLMVKPIKRIKEFRQRKQEKPMLKGKLTYTALAAVAAPVLAGLIGVPLPQETIVLWFQAVAAAVGVYGRWRAKP